MSNTVLTNREKNMEVDENQLYVQDVDFKRMFLTRLSYHTNHAIMIEEILIDCFKLYLDDYEQCVELFDLAFKTYGCDATVEIA